MDKKKLIWGLGACALILALSTVFINDMSNLVEYILLGSFMILVGLIAIVCFVIPDKGKRKNGKDRMACIIAIVFALLCIFVGGKALIGSVIDMANEGVKGFIH